MLDTDNDNDRLRTENQHAELSEKQRQVTAVQSKEQHAIVEGDTVSEQCNLWPSRHTELWISKAYDDGSEMAATINQLLAETPSPLRDAADKMIIFASPPPLRKDGMISGAACHEDGDVFFWQAPDGRPLLRRRIIQHELAHAAGDDGGLPGGLRKRWDQAREIDRRHGSEITQFLSKTDRGSFSVHGTKVKFLLGNQWITEYVDKHDDGRPLTDDEHGPVAEDWACSVESYLWLPRLRAGGLEFGDEVLRFEDLYPGRAMLIDDYLQKQV